jgi:hypothetical protein
MVYKTLFTFDMIVKNLINIFLPIPHKSKVKFVSLQPAGLLKSLACGGTWQQQNPAKMLLHLDGSGRDMAEISVWGEGGAGPSGSH